MARAGRSCDRLRVRSGGDDRRCQRRVSDRACPTTRPRRDRRARRRSPRGRRPAALAVGDQGEIGVRSSAAFLDAVHPRIAVFQAGDRNRFGHPAPDAVERYRERGIAVVATAACGAWQWRADGATDGSCGRDVERRHWRHRTAADPP